jgi:phosphoglycolate phosphatase
VFTTVLFDLDGTLTDSRHGIVACFRHAFEALEMQVPDDAAVERLIGPPLQDMFRGLGVPPELIDTAIAKYRERYEPVGLYEVVIHDGIPQLLRDLAVDGAVLAVATSKPAVYAERVLEHLGVRDSFHRVCGPTLDGVGREKHEVVAAALGATRAGAALMVGDREHDVFGARRCGLRAVGVTWGFGSRDELTAAGAWRVADDAAAVLAAARADAADG